MWSECSRSCREAIRHESRRRIIPRVYGSVQRLQRRIEQATERFAATAVIQLLYNPIQQLYNCFTSEREDAMSKSRDEGDAWTTIWLDAVASGASAMSQRILAKVEQRPGGLESVCAAARARSVHLAVFTDEQDVELVVATRHAIRILCSGNDGEYGA